MRRRVTSGSPFEEQAGYSRAVVDGDMCFVSGTTGYDYATMIMPDCVEQQARNIFETASKALEECGFSLGDVVRAVYYVTDRADVEKVFSVTGDYFRDIRPAATMVIAQLIRPEMKVEIELTARRQGRD